MFSQSIPIIGIQVNLIDNGVEKLLHFSKVIDTYEEPEEDQLSTNETHDEQYWQNKSSWTLENVKDLLSIVNTVFINGKMNYVKNYISISVNSSNFIWVHKRSNGKSLMSFWVADQYVDHCQTILSEKGISFIKKPSSIKIAIDKTLISANKDVFIEIAKYIHQSWNK